MPIFFKLFSTSFVNATSGKLFGKSDLKINWRGVIFYGQNNQV